jgi:hypothetical protein
MYMFEFEVTWSISELSMYFKISHKRIAHFPDLFSNHMFILGRINRIEKAVTQFNLRRQLPFAAENCEDWNIDNKYYIYCSTNSSIVYEHILLNEKYTIYGFCILVSINYLKKNKRLTFQTAKLGLSLETSICSYICMVVNCCLFAWWSSFHKIIIGCGKLKEPSVA